MRNQGDRSYRITNREQEIESAQAMHYAEERPAHPMAPSPRRGTRANPLKHTRKAGRILYHTTKPMPDDIKARNRRKNKRARKARRNNR